MQLTGKKKDDAVCKACGDKLNCAQPGDDLIPHLVGCSAVDQAVRNHAKRMQADTEAKKRKREPVYCTNTKCVCTCENRRQAFPMDSATQDTPSYPPLSNEAFSILVARMFYTCLLAFSVVERPAFVLLFQLIRPDLKLPSRHQLADKLLLDQYEATKADVLKRIEKQGHVSVASDGLSDRRNASIVNFVVVAPGVKSMLWSTVATGANAHDVTYMKQLYCQVLDELKSKVVIAGMMTDNATATSKAIIATRPIFAAGCAAHVCNLLLTDIGSAVGTIAQVKEAALEVIRFVRYHHAMLASFFALQQELLEIYETAP